MSRYFDPKSSAWGPFKPTLILHGGAGNISRSSLPPELYEQYHASLLRYLISTRALLDSGKSALEAASHAVSLFEDDPLFNCGRGSVFTKDGTIEMEASIMVASVNASEPSEGGVKRGAAVSLVRNTRHPILLAKQVLLDADKDQGLGGTSTMHCHLSGLDVEKWGWNEKGLERKGDDWFWTKRRWDEHRRGLSSKSESINIAMQGPKYTSQDLPSQGTVGAVCMDSWGNLCVATSTGGLTNKAVGRIGDTPSIGTGFWAESWECSESSGHSFTTRSDKLYLTIEHLKQSIVGYLGLYLPQLFRSSLYNLIPIRDSNVSLRVNNPYPEHNCPKDGHRSHKSSKTYRAVAMSGTGNGDSFIRTDAARTAAAMCRFLPKTTSLADAVTVIAGVGGELQRSAGDRWLKTGEGQGGIIGIEVRRSSSCHCSTPKTIDASVVFDFNCGGLWRAWYFSDPKTGEEHPKIMVFKGEYSC